MTDDKFAVLGKRSTKKLALVSARTLEDLMERISRWDGNPKSDRFLVVEYQRSGYIELARADTAEELKRKMRQKVGV